MLPRSTAFQVRESLLGGVNVAVFLVTAQRIECLCPQNSNYRAEYVCLFVINLHQICCFLLDVLNRPPNRNQIETRREGNARIAVLLSGHRSGPLILYLANLGIALTASSK